MFLTLYLAMDTNRIKNCAKKVKQPITCSQRHEQQIILLYLLDDFDVY